MTFLVGLKISEIKSGKASFVARASLSIDPLFRNQIEKAKGLIARFNKSSFERFFRVILLNIFHAFGTAGLFVSKQYKKVMERIRGKRFLKTGGIVSFFLKNVSESKAEDKKDV